MARLRKKEYNSGVIRYYLGKKRISFEKYERKRLREKCRPTSRCRAITSGGEQCKNCAVLPLTYCTLHVDHEQCTLLDIEKIVREELQKIQAGI